MEKTPDLDLESNPPRPALPDPDKPTSDHSEHTSQDPTKADVDPSTAVVVVVDFEPSDGGNPRNWKSSTKWAINLGVSDQLSSFGSSHLGHEIIRSRTSLHIKSL